MSDHTSLKYCIFGAGGIGMTLAAFLADIGKDVSVVARGENLAAMEQDGILVRGCHGEYTVPVKAFSEEEYRESPDVIFVCVKTYSLDSVVPFLDRVCREDTAVIAVQNAIDPGRYLQEKMRVPCKMCSAVIYIRAARVAPGIVRHSSPFFRVHFAPRDGVRSKALWKTRLDMLDAGIAAELHTDPVKIALRKFIRVSCMSAVCCCFNDSIGVIRRDPEALALYRQLATEICQIMEKRGSPFEDEAFDDAMTIGLEGDPEFTTSMKRDMDAGRPMEVQTQFFDVYEMGRRLGLPMEAYGKVSRRFGYQGNL